MCYIWNLKLFYAYNRKNCGKIIKIFRMSLDLQFWDVSSNQTYRAKLLMQQKSDEF